MTIKTSDNFGTYIEIVPIKARFTDTVDSNILSLSISDNLTNSTTITYSLFNQDIETSTSVFLFSGIIVMSGSDYLNWTGDNDILFTYTLTKLGLTSV